MKSEIAIILLAASLACEGIEVVRERTRITALESNQAMMLIAIQMNTGSIENCNSALRSTATNFTNINSSINGLLSIAKEHTNAISSGTRIMRTLAGLPTKDVQ